MLNIISGPGNTVKNKIDVLSLMEFRLIGATETYIR